MRNTLLKEGYPLFSSTHILVMAGCASSFAASIRVFRHLNKTQKKKMQKLVSVVPGILEVIQDTALLVKHKMNAQYLPLHLCGQAMFIEPLHAFIKEGKAKKQIGNMIYSLFLPGAAMALVFPGWNNLPLLSGISVKKYAAHYFLVLYGILLYADHEIELDQKTYLLDLSYLYGAALLLWPFNQKFNTNYLYTHEPVDPLRFIWDKYGKGAYICVMVAAGVFLVSAMYVLDRKFKEVTAHENTVCD